jgi:hypothetical protein
MTPLNMNFKKPRLVLLSVLCIMVISVHAQQYSRARILSDRIQLGALGIAVDHILDGGTFIEGDFSKFELDRARDAGFLVTILEEDAEWTYLQDKRKEHSRSNGLCADNLRTLKYRTPGHYEPGNYRGHFTYDQMNDQLDKMAELYPHLVSKRQSIGDFLTAEGRPIEWIRISDNPDQEESDEPQILYTALHHAREPISLTQLIYYMWYVLEKYDEDQRTKFLLDNVEMYFVPCVNPDGYIYNEMMHPEGGGLWRKNRRNNGNGTFGVDLNRNYGHEWGHDNAGSSSLSHSEVYRGPSPFSEPETQAVSSFVESHQFKIALNYHSWGGYLIYPFGYTPQPVKDADVYRELGNLLTRENRYVYGTGLETVAYPTNGDADDWMYGGQDGHSIFSMTPEIGTEEHNFWPHPDDVEYLCQETLDQNLTAAYFLLNSALIFDESESFVTSKAGFLPFSLTKLGFEEVAFTLSFTPITENIEFSSPSKLYILNLFGSQQDNLAYHLSPDIQDGERIRFTYTIDNGSYSRTDTIVKYYREPRFALNNGGEKSEWQPNSLLAQWEETSNLYVSAPTSLTDSPNGNTIPYTVNHLTVKNPISLLEGDSAIFTFKAYWDIQNQYDYLLVEIAIDGKTFVPLCGQYTIAGKLPINKDLPIYTGRQLSWVIERIDLSEFIGEEISLRFTMTSTKADTRDGIYIDDIKILEYNQGDITSAEDLSDDHFESTLFPNPASNEVSIETGSTDQLLGFSQIEVLDQLGKSLLRQNLIHRTSIDVSRWSSGLYYYRLIDEKGRSTRAKKLIISR